MTIVSKFMLLCGLINSFKDFPYSKDQDVNAGKVLGEEALHYVDHFGKEKNLMDKYTFNVQVVEIKYSDKGSVREVILVLKDSVTGKTPTKDPPYDLVIYASQASEPHIPDIPGSQNFKGEIHHSIDFKRELYDNIVENEKKVVVVGGSKAGCDLALIFQHGGYRNFLLLYRTPYLFWKYKVIIHNCSIANMLRGLTTLIGVLMIPLLSRHLGGKLSSDLIVSSTWYKYSLYTSYLVQMPIVKFYAELNADCRVQC